MKYSSKQQATKRTFRLLLLVLLSVGLVAGVYAVQKSQEVRSKAAGGPPVGCENSKGTLVAQESSKDAKKCPFLRDPIGPSSHIFIFKCDYKGDGSFDTGEICEKSSTVNSVGGFDAFCKKNCTTSLVLPPPSGAYKGNRCATEGTVYCSSDPSGIGCPSGTNSILCSSNLWSCSNQPSCVSGGGGGGGVGPGTPAPTDLTQQATCVAQCVPPGTAGVANPTNCGQFGKDPARGVCTTPGALCCKDRADHRPPPEIRYKGISGGARLIAGGGHKTLSIQPEVKGEYSTLKIEIDQEQHTSALSKFFKQRPDGKMRLGFTRVDAPDNSTKSFTWTETCRDTNPSPTVNSCDGFTVRVWVWGLITGLQDAQVKVSATNNNGTDVATGKARFAILAPSPTPTLPPEPPN